MSNSKTPLRTGFQVLDVRQESHVTLYRRIFKSLGLGTTSALYSFFNAVQSNMCRATGPSIPRDPALPPVQQDTQRGFDIEMIEEDPEREIDPRSLGCGTLIIGDQDIAAYDTDGVNVFVAVREESCIVVYNIRDLIASYLCDELRLQFARAVAPPGGTKTTLALAQAGTQSALASLLGLGYFIMSGKHNGETYITVTSRAGQSVSLTLSHMSGVVDLLMKQDPALLSDPEWVFAQISRQATLNNTASKPE